MTTTRARFTVEAVTDIYDGSVKYDVYDNRTSAFAQGTVLGVRVYSMYPTRDAAQTVVDALNTKEA